MRFVIFTSILSSCFVLSNPAAAEVVLNNNLLFVVANPASLTAQEVARKTQFEAWGYIVTTIDDGATQANYNTAVVGKNVAYVSEEVVASSLGTKLKTVTIGVVVEDWELLDDFGFAQDFQLKDNTEIRILNGSHYITLGKTVGSFLTITTSNQPLLSTNGTEAPGLRQLAERFNVGSQYKPALVLLKDGDGLYGGGAAAGRRVLLPWGGDSFDFNALSADGLILLQRALEWASSSLVGHWRFDEGSGTTIADSSPDLNHAAFATGTPTWVSGVRNGGLQFNGSNHVATNSTFAPPSIGSVAFWFRSDGLPSGTQRLFGTGGNWEVRIEPNGEMYFDLGGEANGTQFRTDPGTAGTGRWRHVVALFNATTDTFSLYLDGKFVKSGTINLVPQSSAVLSIGTRTGSSERFNGALDDLRIFNREISAAQVAELYGLVGHWKMDEGIGSTAADSSGNGKNASLSGATWTSDCSGNSGLSFNGMGQTAATSSNVNPPKVGAVAMWFRSAGPVASRQRLWGLGGDFEMWVDTDGLLSCDVSTDGYQGGFITDKRIDEENLWHHIVAQYDSSNESYAIYLNGEPHKSGISTWDIQKQAANILTFGTRTGSTQYWEGALRDFRIYNRWLLDDEIASISAAAGHWRFDETVGSVAIDDTVLVNHGTHVNAPTLGVKSVYAPANGTAVEYDGLSDYTTIPHKNAMLANKGTVMFWFRTNQYFATQGLFSKDSSDFDTGGHLTIRLVGGKVNARLQSTTQSYQIESAPVAAELWTHVTFVWGSGGMYLFVNGVEHASNLSYSGGLGTNSGGTGNYEPIVLGANAWASNDLSATPLQDYLDGAMDDIRFYARAMCSDEVYKVYRGGRSPSVRIIRWLEVR